jgi:hypothetical protein
MSKVTANLIKDNNMSVVAQSRRESINFTSVDNQIDDEDSPNSLQK